MPYQVLARKWRPRTFENIVGQEHVLRVLKNSLARKRLHHAYLFAGTRGVGKTTLARLLAKCLNCEVDITVNPCGSCASCRAIDAGQFLDLYEIDAASRTKVEDTRELLENVGYPPVQGRYKVYLIDEVHMLSGHSFNALLKTLEEPPPHVMFIFATTEPKRLPITILSRCMQFHLKQILPAQIAAQLKRVCESEQVAVEEKALTKLAQAADGSMRDALSLLDQAIGYCEISLTDAEVNQMLGYVAQDDIMHLLRALASADGKQLWDALTTLQHRAPDYQQVLAELVTLLHQAAIDQVVPGQTTHETIREVAQQFSAEEIQLYYQIALLGQKDLPLAPSPALGFEMIMLRLLAFRPGTPDKPLVESNRRVDQGRSPSPPSEPITSTPSVKAFNPTPSTEWRDIIPKLELTGLAYAIVLNAIIEKITDNKIDLILAASYKAMVNQKLIERIEQALTRYFKKDMKLTINITTEVVNSPAKEQESALELRRNSALESMQQSPGVQKIKSLFNATIDTQSVEVGD